MNNINHWYETWRTSDGLARDLAFKNLYKHVYDQALRVVYTVLHQARPDLATDAASDTLLKIPQFKGNSEFATWAYTIARNVALMEARKMNSRKEMQFHTDADELESGADEESEWPFGEALKTLDLTPLDRDLLEAVLSGLRPQDWAEMNGLARVTGWRRWQRLRRKLSRVVGLPSNKG